MKIRWVTLLMIAAMISTTVVFAQSPIAAKNESTVKVAPIATTRDGYDTGITVVNMTNNRLMVDNFKFYPEKMAMYGPEAAQVEAINKKLAVVSAPVDPNGRFSMLLSQIIGPGVNGQLRFSVIGVGAWQALVYEAILSPDFTADTFKAEEVTRQAASPQQK